MEELQTRKDSNGADVSLKLEQTLISLVSDVQNLHEEYKTLESSFRK